MFGCSIVRDGWPAVYSCVIIPYLFPTLLRPVQKRLVGYVYSEVIVN